MQPERDGSERRPEQLAAALRDNDLHVWCMTLVVPDDTYANLQTVLSPVERERAARFHAEGVRRRFVVAHAGLRSILSWYVGVEPAELVFNRGVYGKPTLPAGCGDGTVCFNLSHSADVAVCAVARGHEVGIDVEQIRENVSTERIAAQFFSAQEQALLTERGNTTVAFSRIWVRKEACLKATGEGIGGGLRNFSVTLADGAEVVVPSEVGDRTWVVRALSVPSGYEAAVAAPAQLDLTACTYSP
jgi:4'-phosphopantetheinyl transferase